MPNDNNTINRGLAKFRVEKGNLTDAINNDKIPDALSSIDTLSKLLIQVRSAIRETMVERKP